MLLHLHKYLKIAHLYSLQQSINFFLSLSSFQFTLMILFLKIISFFYFQSDQLLNLIIFLLVFRRRYRIVLLHTTSCVLSSLEYIFVLVVFYFNYATVEASLFAVPHNTCVTFPWHHQRFLSVYSSPVHLSLRHIRRVSNTVELNYTVLTPV